METEVNKQQFKGYYFQYATVDSGWTADYWDKFFEKEEGKHYFFRAPEGPEFNRMFITSDSKSNRMYFLNEAAEEALFE